MKHHNRQNLFAACDHPLKKIAPYTKCVQGAKTIKKAVFPRTRQSSVCIRSNTANPCMIGYRRGISTSQRTISMRIGWFPFRKDFDDRIITQIAFFVKKDSEFQENFRFPLAFSYRIMYNIIASKK